MFARATAVVGPSVLSYGVAGFLDTWTVTEVPVPEAAWHDRAVEQLRALLAHWVRRGGVDAAVYRNLAIRVREEAPRVGFDPDVCVVAPAPPGADELSSLCLWKEGHRPPALCIEVVSVGHPSKDYEDIPARCAAAGVMELWVLDPKLVGPRAPSGPHRVQVFARQGDGTFLQVHAGDGAGWSPVLRAYVVPREGAFVIAADTAGEQAWLTAEQAEAAARRVEAAARRAEAAQKRAALAEKERALGIAAAERRARDEERAAKEEALARVAELEAELRRRE